MFQKSVIYILYKQEEASLETNIMASMCVRNGCINRSIENPGWDNEYCSTDCVVSHCRLVDNI